MVIPSSTYRIQFSPRFTFRHLMEILDYLADLGISTIYASPLLQPVRGSEHGYDGISVSAINPEIGTFEELLELSKALKEKNITWIQDIVPNHLAFHTTNVWLNDVLERGLNSPYANYFDIDWQHPSYPGKLMAPFLSRDLLSCVEEQEVKLGFDIPSGFFIDYFGSHYPLRPESYTYLLSGCIEEGVGSAASALSAWVSNATAEAVRWRELKNELLKSLDEATTRDRIRQKLEEINADKAGLIDLVLGQHYVLCAFQESHTRINYRRFFNVNSLICLRMEDEQVFREYHRYIHSLYQQGIIQGLRIDHVDGLKNPHDYVRRLRDLFGKDCYVIVEKILDVKEELPASMEIQGTSGYEFLSYINQVITDRKGSEQLLAIYQEYVPDKCNYSDIVYQNKFANLETYLNGEWDNLLRFLLSLNLIDDDEIRMQDLKMALGAFMAAFPVYRVYIENVPLEIMDEQLVVNAFVTANARYPHLSYELGILRQLFVPHPDPVRNANRLLFVQRVMQFTGPLAAKGIEDTTFYQFNPLISHNEVGDQPCMLGIPVREFHEKMQQRLKRNAYSLNCTSTHDTKRGEDNRVRINIISELSAEWATLVAEWQKINEPYRKLVGENCAPVINDEYFLYQAIIGGFPEDLKITPEFVERTKRYFTKVLRESKHMSDHVKPNIAYEEACSAFIDHLLDPRHEFLPSVIPFVRKIIDYANTYTMVQVIIKCTAPGIPDIYQGCELWDLSYVDPDNRRPVNFNLRRSLLRSLKENEQQSTVQVLKWAKDNYAVGAEKLFVTHRLLQLRKRNNSLFTEGEYLPVYSEGSDRVIIAFLRKLNDQWLLVVLPLGIVANTGKDLRIQLPAGAPAKWQNIFTGEKLEGATLDIHDLFSTFPVAVLEPAG